MFLHFLRLSSVWKRPSEEKLRTKIKENTFSYTIYLEDFFLLIDDGDLLCRPSLSYSGEWSRNKYKIM